MLKKLRRKFILIAMLSVALVLGIIIGAINVANYRSVCHEAEALLDVLAENNGKFPIHSEKNPDQKRNDKPARRGLSKEAPFESRFFSVLLNENLEVEFADTDRIAAVDNDEAGEYARTLAEKGKQEGFYHDYAYRAVAVNEDTRYIFLDCGRRLDSFRAFLRASLVMSLVGLLVVFLLVLVFSKLALRPVAQSYEKQRQFITDASHEIKTPLTIIDANTELLELEHGESQWTRSTRNQIRRLTSLTEKLVFLSRMDEEGSRLQMLDFSLSDAVAETAQPFVALAETQGKRLELDIEPSVSYCGDESALRQVVSILLDNAVKYSNAKGWIRLRLVRNGPELTVQNSVEEIEQGNLDMLFERFYRRDSSRNSTTGGSGIGLSAARAVVEAHKGKITAHSDNGTSIEVRVSL